MISAYIPAPFFKIWDWIKSHIFWSIVIAILILAAISSAARGCEGDNGKATRSGSAPCNEYTLELYNLGQLTTGEFRARCPDLYENAYRTARWE